MRRGTLGRAERQALKAIRAPQDRRVIPDLLEMLVLLGPRDLAALLDRLAMQDLLVMLALLDPRETLEMRALRVRRAKPEI